MPNAQISRSAQLYLVLVLIVLGGCIQLRPISLYDGTEKPAIVQKPESVDKIVSPILFKDDTVDIWGILSDSCKSFALVEDVKYSGDAGLKLKWERQGCEWVGFGMGWEGYAGKDIAPIVDYAAFQMYVRTPKGKAFGLPFVLTLEDYSGVMAFCYTANKYFERTAIDEEWQKVIVPLKDFNDEGEGIDYGNIKQLQIEMQQSGEVYLDDITLILYEAEEEEPWLAEPTLPDPEKLPVALFADEFINQDGWGYADAPCLLVERSTKEKYQGNQSIHAKWNLEEQCAYPYFGVSWGKWQPINMRPIIGKASLSFYLKTADINTIDFRIEFEDFGRSRASIPFRTSYATKANNDWYRVEIPLDEFFEEENLTAGIANASGSQTGLAGLNINRSLIKTLAFQMVGEGEMYVDQISLE